MWKLPPCSWAGRGRGSQSPMVQGSQAPLFSKILMGLLCKPGTRTLCTIPSTSKALHLTPSTAKERKQERHCEKPMPPYLHRRGPLGHGLVQGREGRHGRHEHVITHQDVPLHQGLDQWGGGYCNICGDLDRETGRQCDWTHVRLCMEAEG